ncbi:MAG: hypothetical protein K2Q25_15255 [Mycobacteriaceae bacterium]|nr:hypothetical protein [Mycobacteriaceae bacterium]
MTVLPDADPPHRDAFTVRPVVEYEPPPQQFPPDRPLAPPALQRHVRHHRGDKQPKAALTAATPAWPTREAAVFADAALRRVLEVIDRRRPATALRPLLAPNLVDSVVSASRRSGGYPPSSPEAGVLRRVRLQAVGRDNPYVAAEAFGTYTRGQRSHAVACRVEQLPTPGGIRWQVVALHIG